MTLGKTSSAKRQELLDLGGHQAFLVLDYPLVVTNIAMDRSAMLLRTVNHLFLWAILHGELLVITRG